MHPSRRAGFTFTDLIVVVGICAVVAVLVLYGYAALFNGGAREKARAASCLSNLKQISLAAKLYMADYDDTFPFVLDYSANYLGSNIGDNGRRPVVRGVTGQEARFQFVTLATLYLDRFGVWYCPKVGANYVWDEAIEQGAWREGATMRDQGTSYAYNYLVPRRGHPEQRTFMGGKKLAILREPGHWPMLCDEPVGFGLAGSAPHPSGVDPPSGFVNVVYGDGHTHALRLPATGGNGLTDHAGDGLYPGQ